ncbi:hypothetical protein D9611_006787 [Ephemerocybe angulata]|uniref:Uncharacterized protein n=1 Tax=Ephemerocybe angulata TaxID=980116 RepID=A0A8H5AZZ2_9AGAR|nr:hypothetical protein D9611_006787 [Tulosesus angulatus]
MTFKSNIKSSPNLPAPAGRTNDGLTTINTHASSLPSTSTISSLRLQKCFSGAATSNHHVEFIPCGLKDDSSKDSPRSGGIGRGGDTGYGGRSGTRGALTVMMVDRKGEFVNKHCASSALSGKEEVGHHARGGEGKMGLEPTQRGNRMSYSAEAKGRGRQRWIWRESIGTTGGQSLKHGQLWDESLEEHVLPYPPNLHDLDR